jgi:S1-C subfamily serine protease
MQTAELNLSSFKQEIVHPSRLQEESQNELPAWSHLASHHLAQPSIRQDNKLKNQAAEPFALEVNTDFYKQSPAFSNKAAEAIVQVTAKDAEVFFKDQGRTSYREVRNGTGFFVSGDGLVATAKHVVGNAKDIQIGFQNGQKLSCRLVGYNNQEDLALLKVESKRNDFRYYSLGRARELTFAQNVYALGYPNASKQLIVAKGQAISFKPNYQFNSSTCDALFAKVNVYPGDSGAPLFNGAGEVVGVAIDAVYPPVKTASINKNSMQVEHSKNYENPDGGLFVDADSLRKLIWIERAAHPPISSGYTR